MKTRATKWVLGLALVMSGTLLAQNTRDVAQLKSLSPKALKSLVAKKLSLKNGPMAKVGPDLAELYLDHQDFERRGGLNVAGAKFKASNPVIRTEGNRVFVEAVASGDPARLLADLKALGLEKATQHGRMVSGTLPIRVLPRTAALESLQFAAPPLATTHVGLVTSQGDQSMFSDQVKSQFGIDGSGIRIGFLSDSYDCLGGAAADITNDDLPSDVTVLDDSACPATDEGRAMMQLAHDVAPGSPMAFHTAFNGQADFALGIIELANVAGSKVIVDDVIYFAEPMFQDGVIAQAVDTVKSQGVSYFSSAGNNARDAYESPFASSGIPGVFGGLRHDFDPGAGVDDLQSFTLATGTTIFSFQWDQPFFSVSGAPGSASDMDIVLYIPPGIFIGIGGFNFNIGGDAVEVFGVTNSGPPLTVELGLELFAGPPPGFMKYVFFGPNANAVAEFGTASGSLYGHANAAGAEAVGAARYTETPAFGQDPPLLEFFSSAGPTPIFFDTSGNPIFDLRAKPEVVGPNGTNTTFFGFDFEPDGFPNFFGTSASAPHVAAVAAMLKETDNSLSPDDVYTLLEDNAVDMLGVGFDFDSGFGLVDAFLSVDEAATDPNKSKKRLVCHNSNNPHTISVSANAVPAHIGHGDKYGPCPVSH